MNTSPHASTEFPATGADRNAPRMVVSLVDAFVRLWGGEVEETHNVNVPELHRPRFMSDVL